MAYKPRKSLVPSEEQEAIRLHLQKVPLREIAEQLDGSYGTIQRLIRGYRQGTANGQPDISEHLPTDHPNVPDGEPGAPPDLSAITLFRNDAVNPSAPEGTPTTPTLPDKVEIIGEPVGLPDSAPLIHDLVARLDVVEAFIASLQRQPANLHGAPQSLPVGAPLKTRKRGFVIAEVLSAAIDAYAAAEHLPVKDILDLGMREFFGRRGWPVEEGE